MHLPLCVVPAAQRHFRFEAAMSETCIHFQCLYVSDMASLAKFLCPSLYCLSMPVPERMLPFVPFTHPFLQTAIWSKACSPIKGQPMIKSGMRYVYNLQELLPCKSHV